MFFFACQIVFTDWVCIVLYVLGWLLPPRPTALPGFTILNNEAPHDLTTDKYHFMGQFEVLVQLNVKVKFPVIVNVNCQVQANVKGKFKAYV